MGSEIKKRIAEEEEEEGQAGARVAREGKRASTPKVAKGDAIGG